MKLCWLQKPALVLSLILAVGSAPQPIDNRIFLQPQSTWGLQLVEPTNTPSLQLCSLAANLRSLRSLSLQLRGGEEDSDELMRIGKDVVRSTKQQKQQASALKNVYEAGMKSWVSCYLEQLPPQDQADAKKAMNALLKKGKADIKLWSGKGKGDASDSTLGSFPGKYSSWIDDETVDDSLVLDGQFDHMDLEAIEVPSQMFPALATLLVPTEDGSESTTIGESMRSATNEAEKGFHSPRRLAIKAGTELRLFEGLHALGDGTCFIDSGPAKICGEGGTLVLGQLQLQLNSGTITSCAFNNSALHDLDQTISIFGGPWVMHLCEISSVLGTAVSLQYKGNATLCGCRLGGQPDGLGTASYGVTASSGEMKLLQCDFEDIGGEQGQGSALEATGIAVLHVVRCLFQRVAIGLLTHGNAKVALVECEIKILEQGPAIRVTRKKNQVNLHLKGNSLWSKSLLCKVGEEPRKLFDEDNLANFQDAG